MAKQFVKGNVYVFSNKKLMTYNRENNFSKYSWGTYVNGRVVAIQNKHDGITGDCLVSPIWCKCIKNNN